MRNLTSFLQVVKKVYSVFSVLIEQTTIIGKGVFNQRGEDRAVSTVFKQNIDACNWGKQNHLYSKQTYTNLRLIS